jgi:hypothetical protein
MTSKVRTVPESGTAVFNFSVQRTGRFPVHERKKVNKSIAQTVRDSTSGSLAAKHARHAVWWLPFVFCVSCELGRFLSPLSYVGPR